MCMCALVCVLPAAAQVKIAQISDSHIGLKRAPQGSEQLRRVVQMVNQQNPDIVVVSGDIGERPEAWDEARDILKGIKAKIYYIPGNHDVHADDVERYRKAFGEDYYKIQVKNVVIYALDSQLLGNWDQFDAKTEPPMPPETKAEGDKMLGWLESQKADKGTVVLAMQHVPAARAGGFPDDPKPYWTVNDPYRSRELKAFKKLGINDVLAGHWHKGVVFDSDGITWHVAPSTSWLPMGGKLGFAMHTISDKGQVTTKFIYLDGSEEDAGGGQDNKKRR